MNLSIIDNFHRYKNKVALESFHKNLYSKLFLGL